MSKSLNGYPKGIFVQTKHDRNQFRQWKAVEKLRKSEFSHNYLQLLEQKRNTQDEKTSVSILHNGSLRTSKSKASMLSGTASY